MSNLKARLLDRFQLTHSEMEVEGEKVFVKQLSAAEAEAYQFARMDPKTGEVDFAKVKGARADLVAVCLCEADGKLMFKSGDEVGESLPASFVEAAYNLCAEFNGMGAETEEAGKD